MAFCKVSGCDEEVSDRSESELCSKCRSSLYYWSQWEAVRVKLRLQKLEFWQGRLKMFSHNGYFAGKRRRKKKKSQTDTTQ